MFKILRHLSINYEVYQYLIPKKIGCSYRTAIRQLQLLDKNGFAKIIRTEPVKNRGKAKNVWQISFKGILFVFSQNPKLIDKVAKVHGNKWIVLQEWNSLTLDPEIKSMLLEFLSSYTARHGDRFTSVKIRSHTKKRHPEHFQILDDISPNVQKNEKVHESNFWTGNSQYFAKTEATLEVLGLSVIFTWKALTPFLEDKKHPIIRHWKNCWNNQAINQFMQQQFKLEKQKNQALIEYEKYFKHI